MLCGVFVGVLLMLMNDSNPSAASLSDLVEPGAELQTLGTGMKFVEGPVWSDDDGGYLIFSDIPANEMKKWTAAGGVTTFRAPSEQANGNTRDLQGRLITCHHQSRRVTITEPDGQVRVLVERYEGKQLNSPNDVVVKRDGTIWFTDPPYGLGKTPKELDGHFVFRFDPKDRSLRIVAREQSMPNGLCFSSDEKRLYVADSDPKKHEIWVYDVKPDQPLADGRVLCAVDKGVPDGIRCDAAGRIWSSAGDGVHVFAPDGRLLGKIPVPQTPSNLCFGGSDGRTLYITARTSLYAIRVQARSR